MDTQNTVTISTEEYYNLRKHADMNLFLSTELGELRNRMFNLEEKMLKIEFYIDGRVE